MNQIVKSGHLKSLAPNFYAFLILHQYKVHVPTT